MRERITLTTASLISILLMTLHLTEDMLRGHAGVGSTLASVIILVVWLYGAVALDEGRPRSALLLLGALLGASVPGVHTLGAGGLVAPPTGSLGPFFSLWTLLALAVASVIALVLSVRGLWRGSVPGPATRR